MASGSTFFALMLLILTCPFASSRASGFVRGVPVTKQALYNPTKQFKCLDSLQAIQFSAVNDDFCDCKDGSDEPGTAACPDMKFHCANAGFRSKDIPSSRVNDGLCDCCDGSDEYDSSVVCFNNCRELDRENQERLAKQKENHEAGFKTKIEYIARGKQKKSEEMKKLETLNNVLASRRVELEKLKALKESAETPEKEAKEKHQAAWEEARKAKLSAKEKSERQEAFSLLDRDEDGSITVKELQANPFLATDLDRSEVFDLLNGADAVDIDSFAAPWNNIRPQFVKAGRLKAVADPESDAVNPYLDPPVEPEPTGENPKAEPTEGDKPDYDETTKRIIAVADEARRRFINIERQVTDLESELSKVQSFLKKDFGPEEEFHGIDGLCFEFADREYTYKLCPFEKFTQRPKAGGSEMDLGRWSGWASTGNKYGLMKYENGQSCWKGPARSTMVTVKCGVENALQSVNEPSRCEYAAVFATPASCVLLDQVPHDEF